MDATSTRCNTINSYLLHYSVWKCFLKNLFCSFVCSFVPEFLRYNDTTANIVTDVSRSKIINAIFLIDEVRCIDDYDVQLVSIGIFTVTQDINIFSCNFIIMRCLIVVSANDNLTAFSETCIKVGMPIGDIFSLLSLQAI